MTSDDSLAKYKKFKEDLRKARTWQTRLQRDFGNLIIISNIAVSLVFPVGEALLAVLTPYFSRVATIGVWSVVAISHVVFGVASLLGTIYVQRFSASIDLNQLEDDYQNLTNRISKQEEGIIRTVEQATAIQFSLEILHNFLSSPNHVANVTEDMGKLLGPLHLRRERALDFNKGDGRYDFSLYLYNQSNDKLEKAWRIFDNGLEHQPQNRSWHPGHGFIGVTFERPDGYWICPDTSDIKDGDSAFLKREDKQNDIKNYRSFIAVRFSGNESGKSVGVLLISSSLQNQFSEELYRPFLDGLRVILSMYFCKYPPSSDIPNVTPVKE